MSIYVGCLENHFSVPWKANPFHSFEDRVYGILGRTGPVRIFDTEQKVSPGVFGVEVIE